MENKNDIKDDTENESRSHTLSFTYKSFWEHIVGFIKIYPKRFPRIVAIFFSAGAIAEIIYYNKPNTLSEYAIPLAILALVISLYENLKQYLQDTLPCLAQESQLIKKIFFKQKLGWQYKIVYEKLSENILKYELSLERMKKGAVFIHPKLVTEEEYIYFVRTQPTTILKLIQAAKISSIEILPETLSHVVSGKDSEMISLLQEIENISSIYMHAVNYEKRIFEIIPPEEYEQLHELMFGWTDPIRDGLKQFLEISSFLSNIRRKDLKKLTDALQMFTIIFEPPENIDEFNRIIEKFN